MSNNLVLASYFNHKVDPQRNTKWENDYNSVIPLIWSVVSKGIQIKIFHNCFDKLPPITNCEWILVEPKKEFVPNVARWFVYLDYLVKNYDNINHLFMVDSTDVLMLKSPFESLQDNILYCGSEEYGNKLDNKWMQNSQARYLDIPDYQETINENKDIDLINCGVVGGDVNICLNLLTDLCSNHNNFSKNLQTSSDMAIFNYTLMKKYKLNYEQGLHITTPFKQDIENKISWWKHK
jgi:hypothetical protein